MYQSSEREKPRLARLTAILNQLQGKVMVTATELSKKHKVSIRTIYRDIRTLEQSGVPIVTEEGKGYRILDGYYLAPISFELSEAQALTTLQHMAPFLGDSSLSQTTQVAIEKIKSRFNSRQLRQTELLEDRLEVRNLPMGNREQSHYLMSIQAALTAKQVIFLSYQSKGSEVTQREVEPIALIHTQGRWIVLGYCLLRESLRYFRLDRIRHLMVTSKAAEERQVDLEKILYYKKNPSLAQTPDIPLTPRPHSFGVNQIFKAMQTVKLAPFQLMGLGITTTPQRASEDLGPLWQRVISENLMQQIPGLVEGTMYAAYTDYQFEDGDLISYQVIVGGKVKNLSDIPEGLVGLEIQGGEYQEFLAKGDVVSAVGEAWGKIWQTPLKRNFQVDLEIYDQRAQNPQDAEVSILVGIEEEVMA